MESSCRVSWVVLFDFADVTASGVHAVQVDPLRVVQT